MRKTNLPAARDALAAAAWVDERLLLEAGFRGRVLSVGGVERALGLSMGGCEVTTVLADPGERARCELVRAGDALAHAELLQVLGWLRPGRRVLLYHQLRAALDDASRAHWDAREGEIRRGLLRAPRVERLRAVLRRSGGLARMEPFLREPDPIARRELPLPSSDVVVALALRAVFGKGVASRMDRALRAWGPEAFAAIWLAWGPELAPRRAALLEGANPSRHARDLTVLSAWTQAPAWDAIDLGVVDGPPEGVVRAALSDVRSGGIVAWWGAPLPGARAVAEPCPWAPDLHLLVR